MGLDRYGESYEKRIDPRGRTYYWATNDPPPQPGQTETDLTALSQGLHHRDAARLRPDEAAGAGSKCATGEFARVTSARDSLTIGSSCLRTMRLMRRIFLVLFVCGCAGCENSVPASPGTVAPKPRRLRRRRSRNRRSSHRSSIPTRSRFRRRRLLPSRWFASAHGPACRAKAITIRASSRRRSAPTFRCSEQMIFDSIIPNALKVFEATRNRKPASHQEFMTEIIGQSNIRLPSLPPQHRYIYDVELGELMVERPKTAD